MELSSCGDNRKVVSGTAAVVVEGDGIIVQEGKTKPDEIEMHNDDAIKQIQANKLRCDIILFL